MSSTTRDADAIQDPAEPEYEPEYEPEIEDDAICEQCFTVRVRKFGMRLNAEHRCANAKSREGTMFATT